MPCGFALPRLMRQTTALVKAQSQTAALAKCHYQMGARDGSSRNFLRVDPPPGHLAAQLPEVLLAERGLARARASLRRQDRARDGNQAARSGDLAARPRVHLLHRELHPLGAPAGQGRDPVDDLARLRRHDHGRRRPPGRAGHRGHHARLQGPVHPRRRRQPAARQRRHVLHPRRPPVRRQAEGSRRGRRRRHRLGLLRLLGLRAGREAEPDDRRRRSTRSSTTSRSSRCRAARRSPKS